MSDLLVLLVKILFLAGLWLLILFTGSVIQSDLFGRKMSPDGNVAAQDLSPFASLKRRRDARRMPTRLRITEGKQEGLVLNLEDAIKIGRSSDCQLILDDDFVSTRHARIYRDGARYLVEDLGSTNGTYMNDERITVPTPFTLSDTLRIGRTLMNVEK